MWGIVWTKIDGTKLWWHVDPNGMHWENPAAFPFVQRTYAEYHASQLSDVRVYEEAEWDASQSITLTSNLLETEGCLETEENKIYSFFSKCTVPNCCAKCSAPLPCKYHD